MGRIVSTSCENNLNAGLFTQTSGMLFASNPVNITLNVSTTFSIEITHPVLGSISVFDFVTDEIGITHEYVSGEVIESSPAE